MIKHARESLGLPPVSLRSLNTYLLSQGWQKMESYGDSGFIFGLENETSELLVPARVLSDYQRRIEEILEVLSDVEQRESLAILRDVTTSEYDLIRVRLPDPLPRGTVLISEGVSLFQESHNLLFAAACSASRPQRAYRAGRNQEANKYMDSVRFGQTEMGSFVASLLSPVPPNLVGQSDLNTGLPPEPFARRVTRTLVSGLRSIKTAVSLADQGGDINAFERNVPHGVSANLCEAIPNLLDVDNRGGIDVSVSWSLVREPPEGRVEIDFNSSDTPVLKEASRILRGCLKIGNLGHPA